MANIGDIRGKTTGQPVITPRDITPEVASSPRSTHTRSTEAVKDTADIAPTSRATTASALGASALEAPRAPAADLDSTTLQGAQSFADQLNSIGTTVSTSDENLVASFLKLQSLDAGVNEQIESQINIVRHELRVAAAIQRDRLEGRLGEVDQLRAQANQAEAEAMEDLAKATYAMQYGTEPPEGTTFDEEGNLVPGAMDPNATQPLQSFGGSTVDVGAVQQELLQASYNSLVGGIKEAADLRDEAKKLRKAGDIKAADAKDKEAGEAEDKITTGLEQLGIPATSAPVKGLEEAARTVKAKGEDDRMIIARFLASNPDQLKKLMPGTTPEQILKSGFGFAEFQQGLKTVGFDADSPEQMLMALAFTDPAMIQTIADKYTAQNPALAAFAGPLLMAAAEKLYEAWELRNQANLILSAYNDAKQAADAGRSAEQTHGVTNRNMERQDVMMKQFFVTAAGDRIDQGDVKDARAAADRSRNEVARLVLEMVDRHNEGHRVMAVPRRA
jgi:hypothetical protein